VEGVAEVVDEALVDGGVLGVQLFDVGEEAVFEAVGACAFLAFGRDGALRFGAVLAVDGGWAAAAEH